MIFHGIPAAALARELALQERMAIIEGKHLYPIDRVQNNPPGCAQHVHVILADKRVWCYDSGATVSAG